MNAKPPSSASPADQRKAAAVLGEILPHAGSARAISMHEISQRTGIPTREIQAIVKFFVEERQVPIGTSTRPPFGYYLIATNKERLQCRNHFIRRALSTLKHARAYDAPAIWGPLLEQLELEIKIDEAGR